MFSERLSFRHYATEDFNDYFKLVSSADVMKMITGRPLTEGETRERFDKMMEVNRENVNLGHYKVSIRENGAFVGHSKLVMTEKNEAEIGYVLMPEFWRKGFGEEIAKTLILRARKISEIATLIAIIDPENQASQRILEKQGFHWDSDGDYFGLPAANYKMKL
ncbi:GNAT family N-acetyltransferase [Aequorivita sp. SDUM287046]|uniref:GNAT family N-acetyltransferase n=1 Tax=Aequorivita aurantiaca TaxID=3053356 RepID=A0ABT8DG81_9FLAO|nr:GNAT family N-acetyltransferase [Aequorivita aurantiaca]MDN3722914.1 GNAT family N-acetyltransferase [Aequorivita aurantiaca]